MGSVLVDIVQGGVGGVGMEHIVESRVTMEGDEHIIQEGVPMENIVGGTMELSAEGMGQRVLLSVVDEDGTVVMEETPAFVEQEEGLVEQEQLVEEFVDGGEMVEQRVVLGGMGDGDLVEDPINMEFVTDVSEMHIVDNVAAMEFVE